MKFVVDKKIFEKFPGVNIGVVVAREINNTGDVGEVGKMMRAEEARIEESYQPETLSQDPKITSWRKAYSSFGFKPKDAKSSVENLYKMVTRGIQIRKINKLVDIYNFICLKYMVPVGGEDIDKMVGDLQLTFADGEKPVKLLGDAEPESPKDGEVIYKDAEQTICRCWNWREADRTKLTRETKNAILVIEGLPPIRKNEVESATHELAKLIEAHCGGVIKQFILAEGVPEIII